MLVQLLRGAMIRQLFTSDLITFGSTGARACMALPYEIFAELEQSAAAKQSTHVSPTIYVRSTNVPPRYNDIFFREAVVCHGVRHFQIAIPIDSGTG